MQQAERRAGEENVFILRGHEGAVRSLAYSPDGLRLASGGEDATLRIWNLITQSQQSSVNSFSSVEALVFTPDGKGITVGLANGEMLIRRGTRWKHPSSIPCHPGGVRGLIHDNNSQLYSCGSDGAVKLWKITHLDNPRTILQRNIPLSSLSLTADGKRLAVGYNKKWVVVYDLPQKKRQEVFKGVSSLCSAFSPEGELLAMPGVDHAIVLVDLAKQFSRRLTGHTGMIRGLVFTPDGRTLISGGADTTVRIWDVESGSESASYRWHDSSVTCVAVSPDGLTAAAGSDDHSIVVWDLGEG